MSVQESFYSQYLGADVLDLVAGVWTVSVKPNTATAGWYTVSKDDPAKREVVYISGFPTATTATVTLRGQDGTTAKTHNANEPFELCNSAAWYNDHETAILARVQKVGDTMTGSLAFSGAGNAGIKPNILTTAQKNALGLAGGDSAIVKDSTLGEYYAWQGGAWVALSTGSTQADATTAVAGKVEKATQAETDAGTDLGGTGASLFPSPTAISASVQKQVWTYAADTGVADAYVVTLVPAPAGYTTGARYSFKATNANTGASTVNFNALGAKSIRDPASVALAAGAIPAGGMIDLIYDGTNMIMQTPSALVGNAISKTLATTKGDILVATAANTFVRKGVSVTDGQVMRVKASEADGLEWSTFSHKATAHSRATGAGTGNQALAHGLGRTPSYVRITAMQDAGAPDISFSFGAATGTGDEVTLGYGMTAAASIATPTAGEIIRLIVAGGGTRGRAEINAISATDVTINWIEAVSGATCDLILEVFG